MFPSHDRGEGARLNPLLIVITTAGFKKDGPCYSQLRKVSVDILEGKKHDDSQLAIIYEPDPEDDWEKEETWRKANPNFGVSVYPHYLKERYIEAKNEGATKEVDFKTKNVNIWTNAASVWIPDRIWMQNKTEPKTGLTYETGLDIGFKRDWCAWVLNGIDEEGYHSLIPYFWIPEDTVQDKAKHENSNILDFGS